jgi:transcriptional regulator with XRE-family HTH domain
MKHRRVRLVRVRKAAGHTQESLAAVLRLDRSTVVRWERAETEPQPWIRPGLARALGVAPAVLDELLNDLTVIETTGRPARLTIEVPDQLAEPDSAHSMYWDAEALRRGLTEVVDHAAMSDANLDDWEHAVQQYGLATRYRPAASLLIDLTADFAELCRLLERRRAVLMPNRLTRVMAQMAGLMSLTLIKLDQQTAARNWARTAKLIACEAGDSQLYAWVRAQEAYAHYYSGNLMEAVYVAGHAQHIANQAPCSGVALAAALEARAHALLGQATETTAALDRAEQALSGMEPASLVPSAFGYNRAQLAFHAGNAYTHLGDTHAARHAHEQALELYPSNDYLDRALVMLDRAECLLADNDIPAAASWAVRALDGAAGQRDQMIDNRARQVLDRVPTGTATLPAVGELRDLLQDVAGQ